MKKSAKPFNINDYKKVFIIVTAVLLSVALGIFAVRHFKDSRESEEFEKIDSQPKVTYSSFEFNEVGSVGPGSVNLSNYIPVKQYGDFYISDNENMLRQTLEKTYNTSVDFKYYIGNNCYSCDINGSEHFYFFGSDPSDLPFYLKISDDWNRAEWFIRSDYPIPDTEHNKIKEIVLVDYLDTSKLLMDSFAQNDLRRINLDDAVTVTDENTINEYLNLYKEESYVYGNTLEAVKKAKENSERGYVLAVFENENLYQCIGTY